MSKCSSFQKRVFDVIFSSFVILLLSPIYLTIAVIIKFVDRGPVFFKHRRVGCEGKEFEVIKFRSMYPDAEERLKKLLEKDAKAREEWKKKFKLKNDPRITPIGKFLRKTSLDELPQFFNVLKGDMSVVGPRPVVKEELEKFYKDKAKYYLSVKPGITGYWQVEGRSDIEDYEKRVEMDVWYVKNQSLWLDIKIILKTIWVMLTGKGAY
ncbi:Undecaprenyl-phosphate galactose phosphotransferase [Thermovibrio ammonificans HB-1]|uniref:Undecaprenyl-phosphate galactose phosphotransferase n=1 Tax=Thermovibrio ammonificans (strain DSM 15698 / JCM 12110 / HB-1) TaxID=648996 RepID=E8T659_THEA1|nr:sugar transferase [Thermovibrio ammonificans]ADU96643.1 Undecaprenyl-phosphate galactose phosphotransferase [Thermovibrio ammonificans HB-1]